jgi:hypothetical protein
MMPWTDQVHVWVPGNKYKTLFATPVFVAFDASGNHSGSMDSTAKAANLSYAKGAANEEIPNWEVGSQTAILCLKKA